MGAEDGGVVRQLIKDNGITYKALIAAEGDEITVSSDDDDVANFYQGDAIDFTAYDDTVSVDLGGYDSDINGEAALFRGAKTLRAGSADTTLKGSDANETLYAGTGAASLYGAGGRNVLANSNTEKESSTAFFVLAAADGAHNTIQGFEFLTTEGDGNAETADVLEIGTKDGNYVSNVFIRNTTDVLLEVSNANGSGELALIEGAVGQDMKVSNYVAQVNQSSLNYDGEANFFVATQRNAVITVSEDVDTLASIWLGNQSNSVFVGDIKTIDATDSTVKAELAGNDLDNVIMAGFDNASLWGGNGGDDLLVGGDGQNMFFYTNGNGNDTIQGAKDGDVVYLSAVTLENLAGSEFNIGSVTLNFNDGGKLTVENAANCSFVLGDQTYYVNGEDFTTEKP